jgi:hypothetical protein
MGGRLTRNNDVGRDIHPPHTADTRGFSIHLDNDRVSSEVNVYRWFFRVLKLRRKES